MSVGAISWVILSWVFIMNQESESFGLGDSEKEKKIKKKSSQMRSSMPSCLTMFVLSLLVEASDEFGIHMRVNLYDQPHACAINRFICSAAGDAHTGASQHVSRSELIRATVSVMTLVGGAVPAFAEGRDADTKMPVTPAKTPGLSIDEVQAIVQEDFVARQYFVTGNMTRSLYADDCRFRDPTTDVRGLNRYILAVSNLFDPTRSHAELVSIQTLSETKIKTAWILEGTLKLPWKPYIPPVRGTTIYELNSQGLISLHDETWHDSEMSLRLPIPLSVRL